MAEVKRGSHGMYIDSLVNHTHFIRAFCDSGCLLYAAISERFARKVKAKLIDVQARPLEQFTTSKEPVVIRQVASFVIDIDGLVNNVYAYVIPGQVDDLVLGNGWMERHDVVIEPRRGKVTIRSPVHLEITSKGSELDRSIKPIHACAIRTIVNRARKQGLSDQVKVFSVTLADIQKALQRKTYSDPSKVAPDWLQPVLYAFNREDANRLPPHRPGLDHQIDLIDNSEPPNMPLYEMSREQLLVLRKTLVELLDNGFIRASSSPAGAPVIFVKKPGGGLRFCVDYRGLNAVSKKDSYPLPLIGETLKLIASAKWVSNVDVISAFHRVRIKEGDEAKTAFKTRLGSYEWLVTPFGLCGAPSTFQRYINWVLRDELDLSCSAYLDDVVIFSNGTQSEHRKLVLKIVGKLGDAGLQLDIDKSSFEAKMIKYLGYIIKVGYGIEVDPAKTEALRTWEPPKTVKGVRGFLGFVNYYRQFIPRFSDIATPLTALTKKDCTFRWDQACQEAFDQLRTSMISAPILVNWDPEHPTQIETDASGYALGGALIQQIDNLWFPVAFCSRKLLPAEANYPIHDKEMLAIVFAIKTWRNELAGVPFVVISDHKNLAFFKNVRQLNERQMRWRYDLSEYEFEIVHRAGKDIWAADALSRRDQDMPADATDDRLTERTRALLTEADGKMVINRDPSVKISKAWATNGDWDDPNEKTDQEGTDTANPHSPFDQADLKALWEQALAANVRYKKIFTVVSTGQRKFPSEWGLAVSISECSIDNGLLTWRGRTWIPAYEPLRTTLIQQIHDSALTGHPGRDTLISLISRSYTWPGLNNDVRQFLRNCQLCRQSVIWRETKAGLLKPLPIPDRPWRELAMDFIVKLPLSEWNGHRFENLLVVTDRLSKNVILIPMDGMESIDVARALLQNVFAHHSFPDGIVSDRGPQFTSAVWKSVCKLARITRKLSTAFHPETDGSTERVNQEVKTYLRTFCSYSQEDWAPLTPLAAIAINGKTSASTGMSPFMMTHGFDLDVIQRLPPPDDSGLPLPQVRSPQELGEKLVQQWANAASVAQAALISAHDRQEKGANRHRRQHESFQVGDHVWLKLTNVRTERPNKSLDWKALPYVVTEVLGSHNYRLNVPRGIHDVFHAALLKPRSNDPLPSQQLVNEEPPPIFVEGTEEFEIQRILRHRKRGRGHQFLVKWAGWEEPTWEPSTELEDTIALTAYERKVGIRFGRSLVGGKRERAQAGREGALMRGAIVTG